MLIADFHIHSKYSIATSPTADLEHLDLWAKIKGIDVLGTGDCTHPGWFKEIKKKTKTTPDGLLKLNPEFSIEKNFKDIVPKKENAEFILTGEVSCIYKKNGRVRKVHNIIVLPDFDAVEKLQKNLSKIGNIAYDGRPILGLDAKHLLEIVLNVNEQAFIIPAHIWTPHFSVLGAKSGFDSVRECYDELTKYIFAVETGLSSDPLMNRMCSQLDNLTLVSNSDSHSPEKIGREANMLNCVPSFHGIKKALQSEKDFLGTIEFFPEEGKYHFDGHRKCGVCLAPEEAKKLNYLCPVCKKELTPGVMRRVYELADRNEKDARKLCKFYSTTPLISVAAQMVKTKAASRKARVIYYEALNKIGSEFDVLLFSESDEIKKKMGSEFAEKICNLRSGNVELHAGYDGEYGEVKIN